MLKINLINDKKTSMDENFKKKLSFLAELENDRPPFLSLGQMHHLIQEKKLRRKENVNIFVFPISDSNQLELNIFFGILDKNINKAPARFQLAIQDNSNSYSKHWYAVDCHIKNNHFYLLIIDPVFFSDTKLLIKSFPDSLANRSTCFQYKGSNIQYSNYGCSFFAIDNLFRLSNRYDHWHELLKLKKTKGKLITYFSDDVKEFPNSLAFIFKNIQSLTAFESLKIPKSNAVNKKGDTLQQIVEKYSHDVEVYYGQSKTRNLAILHKREKYNNKLENFSESKVKNLTESRQGFEIIGGKEWVENNIELLILCIKNLYFFNSFITNIPYAQRIAIYEVLKEKLRKEVRDRSDFDNFIGNLTLEQRTSEYGMLKENVRPNICNCFDFYQYLNNLTPEQRIEEYEALKVNMRTSIQSCSDFKYFIKNLTPEQRSVEYEMLKGKMRSLIQNSSNYSGTHFNDFIENLSPLHSEIEYNLLKEKIRSSIKDSYNFSNYIRNLTLEQRMIEYEALKEKIRSSISHVSNLNWFIGNLTPEQKKAELEALKEKLRSSVRNGSDFSNYVKYLMPEQRIEEYHKLKQQVRPGILKSEGFGDFGRFLYYLEPEQCKIECEEFINFLMKNNSSSFYNRRYFSDAFGILPHHEQRVVVMMAYNSPAFNKKTKVGNKASNSFFSHKENQENNEDINIDSFCSALFTR